VVAVIVVSPQMQAWVDRTQRDALEARLTAAERRRAAYLDRAAPAANAMLDRIATACHA